MEDLLRTTIADYRRMLSLLERMGSLDLEQPEAVLQAQTAFAGLQADLEKHEGQLSAALSQGEIPAEWGLLLQERRDILAEVAETNRRLAPRITATLALVQAELSEIRTGRSAMAGYAQGSKANLRGFKAQG